MKSTQPFPQKMWKSGLGILRPTNFFSDLDDSAPMHSLWDSPAPYPEAVRPDANSPAVPAEALARRRRLQATLEAMEAGFPSLEPACLQALRSALKGCMELDPVAWLQQVQAQSLVEESLAILRASQRGGQTEPWLESLEQRLLPLAIKAQAKRLASYHLDSRRVMVRYGFSKAVPALDFDDRDLQLIFLQAFRLEGLIVALDLGKRPRPLLTSDHPLPAGVGGLAETMEVTLRTEPRGSVDELVLRLQRRLPDGLQLHGWAVVPNHAAPLGDRGICSHWQWCVPLALQRLVQERCQVFMATGAQADAFFLGMAWADPTLSFSSRLGESRATNPSKALAAWLGVSPSEIRGILRVGMDLRADARLAQGDRFEPKLKNLYEDAVLLGGGSNIVLVDEDDDDPIQLG